MSAERVYVVHVKILEAVNIPVGDPARASSDAYLKLKVKGHKKYRTSTVRRTRHPIWKEEFTFTVKTLDQPLYIKLMDQDFLRDKLLGLIQIPLRHLEAKGVWQDWVDFRNKTMTKRKSGSLFVKMVLDPDSSITGKDNKNRKDFKNWFLEHRTQLIADKTLQLDALVPLPEKVKLFVGTWNVGNKPPPDDFSGWIPKEGYDVITIGAQECEYKPRKEYGSCQQDFCTTIAKYLGEQYQQVAYFNLLQMRLVIFAHLSWVPKISNIDTHKEATGIAHVYGNKGGVVVSAHILDTRVCFVNSHLAAHQHKTAQRNADVKEIIQGVRVGYDAMDIINQFHHLFWLGDLNYRLSYGIQGDEKTPSEEQHKEMVDIINEGKFATLAPYDQLSNEMKESRVFIGFKEGPLNFAPTFKVKRDKELEYDEERSPAWCDRVLWRSFPTAKITQTALGCSKKIVTSDHKPVYATFDLDVSRMPCGFTDMLGSATLTVKSLRGFDLPIADLNNLADPYICFVGDFLPGGVIRSKRKDKTLNPVYDDSDIPVMKLLVNNPPRLKADYLLISVMDYDVASGDDRMGCGYLPLEPYVSQPGKDVPFVVHLNAGGLPAGKEQTARLEGIINLNWQPAPARKAAK